MSSQAAPPGPPPCPERVLPLGSLLRRPLCRGFPLCASAAARVPAAHSGRLQTAQSSRRPGQQVRRRLVALLPDVQTDVSLSRIVRANPLMGGCPARLERTSSSTQGLSQSVQRGERETPRNRSLPSCLPDVGGSFERGESESRGRVRGKKSSLTRHSVALFEEVPPRSSLGLCCLQEDPEEKQRGQGRSRSPEQSQASAKVSFADWLHLPVYSVRFQKIPRC
mmetsp:Transcript_3831/g.7890  ORF Transcript_3831/g.7890 Transcript_3831/m.7890 type:complete len:223 (+) Transcript_3831:365-1033(+)